MPSKAIRIEERRQAQLVAERRRFLDLLPSPDQHGHVIPLVAQLVNEIHTETTMRSQTNMRHVRAVLGGEMFKLYVVPRA